jgi:type VI secretion system secreted protein VgrG
MTITQTTRKVSLATPLGEDVLLFRSMEGHESISRPFVFQLDLLSQEDAVSYDAIVGQRVDLRLTLADDSEQHFNGFVSRFTQGSRDSNLVLYHATVVPWLWFLDQTTDCRIFQKKKVPEIVQQIFGEYGFTDYTFRLTGTYKEREYCVQYRESDFNFISRLLEEEGIFYFFEHQPGKHIMVMGDDASAHRTCAGQPVAGCQLSAGGWKDQDVILEWWQQQEYRPGVYTLNDYSFENPTTSLLSTVNGKGKYEVYDYPGEYLKRPDGESLVRIRLEEQQTSRTSARGASNCRAFGLGYKFDLKDHYRQDLNQTYVLTSVHHQARHGFDYVSGGMLSGNVEPEYRNTFECVPYSTPIRPARLTPTPAVQGCQTAVVVGPPGEEIFTDKYGRVKVQFHWDREGKRDENSSCWIRVSQPWAGKLWGGMQIPRIGQEVVVDFLEGDPDRPVITGRVYNAAQMPPWELPDKKVVSGFKSNSTKGGGGHNEFSFDDTKGKELINLYGQYDMHSTILHDERALVKNNKNLHVVKELRTNVEGKVSHAIKGDLAEHFQSNHAEIVDGERYLKANRIILEAGQEICLKVGGNHVHIHSGGVYVEGTGVDINCGHAPQSTSLSGLTPTAPEDPS